MKSKKIIQKLAVFLFFMTIQTVPISYAAEVYSSEPKNEEIIQEQNSIEKSNQEIQEELDNDNTEDDVVNLLPEFNKLPDNLNETQEGESSTADTSSLNMQETSISEQSTELSGWILQGGEWYYYTDSGEKAYGRIEIGGQTYFFSDSGVMLSGWIKQPEGWYYANSDGEMFTGWLRNNGAWYYLDGADEAFPGVMMSNCEKEINGDFYRFDDSGAMFTGWYEKPEGWYYYSSDGVRATGWMSLGKTWYYLDGNNEAYPDLMLENEKKVIGSATYFFDSSGAMRTGWIKAEEGWYYSDFYGATGWKYINNSWYYLDSENSEYPGLMIAGCEKVIDGQKYCFDSSGVMRTGWVKKEEGWYYYGSDGARATGWMLLGKTWYYLDDNNETYPDLMLENEKKVIGSATYFFDSSGAMRTGWIKAEEGWYYSDFYGATGWKYIKNGWYYLESENPDYPGLMVSDDKKEIAGALYFFNADGKMQTGWVKRSEGWYYTDKDGVMQTGWVKVGSKWYYLDASDQEYPGIMLASCERVIDGQNYVFTSDGSMRSGWVLNDDNWYYYDTYNGLIKSGWQYIDGAWYYLDPDHENRMVGAGWHDIGNKWYYMYNSGAMATNWLNKDGGWYYLGTDGAMKTGWQLVKGIWYYMYKENDPHGGRWGMMACNTEIDGYWLQANGTMITQEEYNMSVRAQRYSSSTGYLILVDRAACKVGIFTGGAGSWSILHFWDCAPGKASTPTVSGEFTVQSKGYYFDSGSSRCYWYTQFYGNYLFHSVLYSKYTGDLVDGRVGIPLSHGCVRLVIDNAKWIYDNIPRGTKVVVY